MNRPLPRVPFPTASTRLSPSPSVQPVEGRIKRFPIHLDDGFRNVFEALGNPVPMCRLQGQDFQDQHVERALRQWESVQST
jgi:hypothetical protein